MVVLKGHQLKAQQDTALQPHTCDIFPTASDRRSIRPSSTFCQSWGGHGKATAIDNEGVVASCSASQSRPCNHLESKGPQLSDPLLTIRDIQNKYQPACLRKLCQVDLLPRRIEVLAVRRGITQRPRSVIQCILFAEQPCS